MFFGLHWLGWILIAGTIGGAEFSASCYDLEYHGIVVAISALNIPNLMFGLKYSDLCDPEEPGDKPIVYTSFHCDL